MGFPLNRTVLSFDEQNLPAEILYENEAETEFPNGGGKIQDCKCVVRICFHGASSQQNSFDEQNPPAEIPYAGFVRA